ncbi:MAG: NAD(P)/FAD-dependent oxidoreductase [Actinobacteria bacterium]|nr:NAD(P)/FAD-dependent oxidoreductase [Actinomycetota bacterium]
MVDGQGRHAEVAGGGFAGLAAAAALAQRGWSVTMHEKGAELRALGAGIVMWNNSLKVLDALGMLSVLIPRSMTPPFYETRVQNEIVSQEDFDGLHWRTMTRKDLHQVMVDGAMRLGVEIRVDSEVVAADPSGWIELANGERREADLVVGADGVASKVRESIGFGQKRSRYDDGITRLIVPRNKEKLGPGNWDNVIDFWRFEPRVLRVLYVPCNENDLYIALMAPIADKEGSTVPISLDLWAEHFPHLRPILEPAAKLHGRYDGYQTNVLDTWSAGSVALVGDAGHAMCPALGQGAGCALVNAYTLAQNVSDPAFLTIADALQAWEIEERPYTDRCQSRSAFFADTRSMSKGNQFTDEVLETAKYDPTAKTALGAL